MDFTLTILILVFGLIIIGFIYFAAVRAQVSRREKKDMRKFEKMLEQSQGKDTEGFDIDGVSEVRLVESSQEKAAQEKAAQEKVIEDKVAKKVSQHKAFEKSAVKSQDVQHEEPLLEDINENVSSEKSKVQKQLVENPLSDDSTSDVPVLSEYLFGSKKEPTIGEEPVEASNTKSTISEPAQASLFSDDKSEPDVSEPVVEPELIFSLYLVSNPEQPYAGEALVEKLLELGMRHGDMDIFHRHSQSTGRGPVQFSLANAYDPGTFDLDNLKSLETKGLAVFMALPGPKSPMKAYEMMASTCRSIVEGLGGHIIDSSKAHYSKQIEAHHKEQIQEFERKLLLKK